MCVWTGAPSSIQEVEFIMVSSADWALGQPAGGFPSCTDELMEPICHAGEPLAPPNAERMLESSDEETPGTLRAIGGNSEWDEMRFGVRSGSFYSSHQHQRSYVSVTET